ncbi:MAG TPA: aldehyde dehydrogenase [Steroidobacteraceae bacterium]|nr:aldehyde dehydrogenase [Steroidobacteraceae bacterium]
MLQKFGHHIGGKEVGAATDAGFLSHNPVNGQPWGRFASGSAADVDLAVTTAAAAFTTWSKLSPTARGRLLVRWAESIRAEAERIGRIESVQNGKLLRETVGQARALPEWLYYYAGLADKIEGAVIPIERPQVVNYTMHEPLGVVGIITPWNSPSMLTMFAAAPALAAGNTLVIKPSEVTSVSMIELARLAEAAGIPAGVINVVTGPRETAQALVDHPQIAKIAFTGSVEGGRAVAKRASERLIGVTLELGGKSPQIVFADADLKQAQGGILGGIFSSTGQTCVAGSRLYVQRRVHDELVAGLVERVAKIRIGDPLLERTQMGPVATIGQLQKDERMTAAAAAHGARVLCGGKRLELSELPGGYFFAPTILGEVARDNPIQREEVFGPVLSVVAFDEEEEALELANDSQFGLAAGVWTLDFRRAHRVARAVQAGTVWVNMYRTLGFNSPVHGHKQSGLGSQNGQDAIYQYLQTKSIWNNYGTAVDDPFADPV